MSPESTQAALNLQDEELRQLDLNTEVISVINDAGISLRDVTKRYGRKAVVDGISLVIEPGEFMTFLGPSGSGKTTTLNMIAGFVTTTEGLLHIYGKPVAKLPAHKRDIGMVFQNYALFPHKTVAENIAYPLERRKIPKAEQKTLIAGALQATMLYVTHDQEEALSLSDRIAVFNNGRLEQVGSPAELYQRPETLFVGRFLGESTVLTGSLLDSVGGLTTVTVSGHTVRVPGTQNASSLAILIRPENIALVDEGTASESSAVNSLPVTVLDSSYLGSAWRCEVQLPDGSTGIVRETHSTVVRQPGTRALMRWNIDAGVLLVDTGDSGESLT